jgi:formate/nitrite transporter FocA (FNT family)
MSDKVMTAFERSVDEGERRVNRSWPSLLATGAVGGIDVGVGVLAVLVVLHGTGNELLAALAFGIGFIALTLASSELFTEGFLVPVTALVAGKANFRGLFRLWGGTAAANLAGGWVFTGLVMVGFPELHEAAVEVGTHYAEFGINTRSFAAGIIGGAAITLMTWMERGTDSMGGKLTAAVSTAFLLTAAKMNHAIVLSLMMFAALHAGAPFGYADWLGAAAWATVANIVGGLGLVTMLRLVQVGRHQVENERRRPIGTARPAPEPTPVAPAEPAPTNRAEAVDDGAQARRS